MAVSLLRSRLGQRTEMSKSFSPSTMLDRARAPRALVTTLLTSAVCTPQRSHLLGIDAELQVRLAANVEDADVLDAPDLLQDVLRLGGQHLRACRCPARRS